ncbi:MAG TPA: endoglucanase [Cyanobacteria bacterium UBA11149]|nr:endoglucanase [Cyanobacteria bacterium UBA11367]HBE60461.1 endoglucanase [Cyanobacteria bacterium UBA11366]HBK65970.1 endoglucanase [Cyanobacteria bacterium UBA11166]HBR73344.1 endoglucanase [Cyanobacteria bacterium UBA11159]HBS70668.1 endoglucanase [Cyanobacteria bacterium UBA11153]HBW91414.1 endoglucanase [Cyanobacteria bacterium UBA11149]HCA95404.1 endoglucanase [Cyanobacteria bacterium UBA9226]
MFQRRNLLKFIIIFFITVFIFSFNCLSYWIFDVFSIPGLQSSAHKYNYGEVLQKAIYFYEAQRSGKLPVNNRVEWRGDSGLNDGADNKIDLTGGWYDAGDHVKFGLPMAASTTILSWGLIEYGDGYKKSGQYQYILDNLRWVNDYFMKAHPSANVLWGQVGKASLDHDWWGPAEVMQMARPSYKIDQSCPGSDLAGETAAAMAASSMVFKETDATYANTLLRHAKELFQFAEEYQGIYSDCITEAKDFYKSSGYNDELAWAAGWLYRATGDKEYLSKAEIYYDKLSENANDIKPYNWTHTWDDKSYGTYVLLAELTGEAQYQEDVERWLDYWCDRCQSKHIYYTKGGLAWLSEWGSLRYTAKTAFLAFVYSDSVKSPWKKRKYAAFGERQINYILGNNPQKRSYIVGFGNNPPTQPHHRTAHGSWANNKTNPEKTRHILYGALIGGPDKNDNFIDDRSNFKMTEVATDYNGGLTGAIARMYTKYGGQPLANFPPPEEREDEFFVEAEVLANQTDSTTIRTIIYNQSGWPARIIQPLSFRYFVDLSEVISLGAKSTDINVNFIPQPGVTISQLNPWGNSTTIYYLQIDVDGSKLYPGGEPHYKKEVQFSFASPIGMWNPDNDWSYQEIKNQEGLVKRAHIPVYDKDKLIFGAEPNF